ncbi:MAG: fused MFS/spermidine synthase [Xanthomonadales bacterium]
MSALQSTNSNDIDPLPTRLVLFLFFISGALALVYQVVWSRVMTHVFGSTALAVGTVIAAFMAGMAVGSWWFGRLADRSRNGLRLYALVEIGIAAAAVLAHVALNLLDSAYPAVYQLVSGSAVLTGLVRFLLAFLLVMAPTVLMGATLPVLTRLLATTRGEAGRSLSTLYAVNTFGAVAGVLLTGFFLIGRFGIHAPVYLAAAGNLAVGLVALALASRRSAEAMPYSPAPRTASERRFGPQQIAPGMYRLVLLGLGVSGLTSFAYEIYWTRSLVFVLGNSTYALTTMLSAFLTGIALGGWLIRYVMARAMDRAIVFGCVQVLLGILAASALPLLFSISDSQSLNHYVLSTSSSALSLLLTGYGVAFLVMLGPAVLIGMTFPLVGSLGIRELTETGASVGRVYAVNTIGNVLGALLPGLVLIEWLGIQRGIVVMALLNIVLGFVILAARLHHASRPAPWRIALPALLLLAVLATSRAPLQFQFPSENERSDFETLYYREGPLATTKVYVDPASHEKHMSVDGIVIGGTGNTEFKQLLLAHLPKLLVRDYSSELSVGLGSGILVGESALHENVERITSVEIEPSVIAGAAYFATENHRVLERPRVDIVADDIGNFLRTTTGRYRVITADEKTADEYASNGFSYSQDYYELLRGHLAPGGLLMQWVPATLPPRQFRLVLNTFASSFPHVQLWYFMPAHRRGPFNALLVGALDVIEIDPAEMDRRLAAQPHAFASLEPYGLTSAMAILPHFVAADEPLRNAVRDAGVNSLDFPRYEFFYPWDYALGQANHMVANHGFLFDLKRSAHARFAAGLDLDPPQRERFNQTLRAEFLYLARFHRFLTGMALDEIHREFDATLAMAPWNDSLRARIYAQYAYLASTRHDPRERARLERKAASLYSGD